MDLIETDSSEMCQQVLKQAVLTAGGKAVVAMRMMLEKCRQHPEVNHPKTTCEFGGAVLCFFLT